jgi:OFA family oxalate/formate antiporter-like MFS transporter
VGYSGIALLLDEGNPGRTLAVLYVFFGVLGGGGVGLSYNTLLGVISRWFPGRAGMASGVLLLGFGVGGLALGSLVSVLASPDSIGARYTFLVLGILFAAVLAIGSFFVKLPEAAPAQAKAGGSAAAGKAGRHSGAGKAGRAAAAGNADRHSGAGTGKAANGAGGAAAAAPRSYTLGEAARTGTFWLIFSWVTFMCIGGLLVINSAAPIAALFGAPAAMGLIVSVFNGAGRPIIGTLFDKLGRRRAMLLNTSIMLAGGVALIFAAASGSGALAFVGLPLIGISYGGVPAILSASVNKFYGPRHYQLILGAVTFSLAAGAIIGPLLSSGLQQNSSADGFGGVYFTSFALLVAVAAVALALSELVSAVSRKNGLEPK